MTTQLLGLRVNAARARAHMGAALALASAVLALAADPAAGAAAQVDKQGNRLVFTAGATERNRVSVSAAGGAYTITDAGAPVSAGAGCTAQSPGTVRCSALPGSRIDYVRVATSDLDDSVSVLGAVRAVLDGGSGGDVLRGGDAADELYGSFGDDVLDGGFGADFISGSDGRDRVDYSSRVAAVSVSPNGFSGDGQAGEGDNVWWSVEEIVGGAGNDVLAGGSAANLLAGGAGADTLTAAGGDDTLDGGPGRDVLDGGTGNDRLSSRDGEVDDDRCGSGVDSVTGDGQDLVAADCEARDLTTMPGGAAPASPAAVLDRVPAAVRMTRSGRIRIRLSCPVGSAGCEGVLSAAIMDARERALGVEAASIVRGSAVTRFSLRAGESKVMDVKISRNGRRRVLRDKKANCRVRAVTRSAGGGTTSARKTVVVKAPKKHRSGR
jgi:hypothetical protein